MLRLIRIVCLMLLLAGCSARLDDTGMASPLLFSETEIQNAPTIYVMAPGALTSVSFFEPATRFLSPDGAFVYYRLPGLDGLSLDHQVDVERAAETVASFLADYPEKRIRLIGYSLGGAILISAASKLHHDDIKVAAISPAVENGGGYRTALRSAVDLVAASLRAGSLSRAKIWREYYATLLFGRKGLGRETAKRRAEEIWRQEAARIVIPEGAMPDAHSKGLRNWSLPEGFSVGNARIRFYVGAEDPVFSPTQTKEFAEKVGVENIMTYEDHGHILPISNPKIYEDVIRFFDDG